MGKITRLPKEVVERISAGEVIERPVSIFKELVENSLDAKAKRIDINVFKGGKEKIVVVDDGEGISFDDLSSLFVRFSTSKIKKMEDIENITTFGFRGEALASIAAVAHISICSKPQNAEIGGFVEADFGVISKPKITNCDYGTQISVENIFDNFPARKRFLKSVNVEFQHIVNWLRAFALSNPHIEFHFRRDGEPYFLLKKANSVTERIEALYGKEILNNIEFLNFENEEYRVLIYFNRTLFPSVDNFNFIFVNKRYVKNMQLSYILKQSVTGFLPADSKFSYIIFIDTLPHNIDVNVHPAKIEVKFRNFVNVSDIIVKGLRGYFEKSTTFINLDTPINSPSQVIATTVAPKIATEKHTISSPLDGEQKVFLEDTPKLAIQLFNSYILVQNKEHIALYDQHALSERVLLTKLINDAINEKIEVQILSVPHLVEMDSEIVEWLEKTKTFWKECGFDFDIASGTQIKVNGLPVQFSNFTSTQIQDAFEKAFLTSQKEMEKKEIYYHLLKEFGCKRAIKQGEVLTREDMLQLVETAEKEGLYTCIHGRPVKLTLSIATLEKFFKRT
ncbi:MAG: DNA mismatch repair endonuclease MutL [Planctomycetota bacterium]